MTHCAIYLSPLLVWNERTCIILILQNSNYFVPPKWKADCNIHSSFTELIMQAGRKWHIWDKVALIWISWLERKEIKTHHKETEGTRRCCFWFKIIIFGSRRQVRLSCERGLWHLQQEGGLPRVWGHGWNTKMETVNEARTVLSWLGLRPLGIGKAPWSQWWLRFLPHHIWKSCINIHTLT